MNFKEYCENLINESKESRENLLNEGWIETSTTEYLKKYLQDVKGIRQKTKLAIEAELRKRGNQDQKLNQESFIQKVLHDGFIPIDNGKNRFVVTQINDKNFTDIGPKLKQQLIEEGKWNSWIGFIWWKASDQYSVQALPIYGSSDRYITKWFTNTAEEAIKQSLRDKNLQLLQRANN